MFQVFLVGILFSETTYTIWELRPNTRLKSKYVRKLVSKVYGASNVLLSVAAQSILLVCSKIKETSKIWWEQASRHERDKPYHIIYYHNGRVSDICYRQYHTTGTLQVLLQCLWFGNRRPPTAKEKGDDRAALESGLTTNPQIWLHWPIRLDFIVEYETFTPDENIGPGSISFANREFFFQSISFTREIFIQHLLHIKMMRKKWHGHGHQLTNNRGGNR